MAGGEDADVGRLFRMFIMQSIAAILEAVGAVWTLTHLVVLICCHSHELGLGEHVRPEGAVGKLQDVVGPHYVEPGLVLVHGVQDRLDQHTQKAKLSSEYHGMFMSLSLRCSTSTPGRICCRRIIQRIVIDAVIITV